MYITLMLNGQRIAQGIICLCSIVHLSLYSQEPDSSASSLDTTISLDKMVVTATRTRRLISESPANISVITKKDIAASPAKTVEDLLVTQTGVQATRTAAIGEGIPSSIIIRGIPGSLAASRTLILVDGIPTNASGTPFLIVNEIPMEAIERIEVVRGPHSSLYGANAVGGVINIITKEGYGAPNGGITAETSYPFTIAHQIAAKKVKASEAIRTSGKLSYWNGSGTVNGGNDRTGYLASAGYRSIGNYLLSDSALRKSGNLTYFTKADNYNYTEYRLFGKGRWYLTNNCDLSLHARYFNSNLGFGKTKNIIPDSQDVDTRGNKFLIGPSMKLSLSPEIQLRAGAFYRQVIGEFINEGQDSLQTWVPSIWQSNTKDWQIETQGIVSLIPGNTITVGLEYLDNNANFGATKHRNTGVVLPNSFDVHKGIVNVAAFLQDEMKLWGMVTLIPAVRLDYHSEFASAVSPKLGLSVRPSDRFTVRASSGRSFRAPSLAELYMPDLTINPKVILIANPGLEPEYVWGSDIGFDWLLLRSVTVKVDAYYNAMSNLISQMIYDPNISSFPVPITHRNIAESWSQGLEGEVSWKILPRLGASINGTLQRSKDKMYDVPLDYIPEYTVGLKITGSYLLGQLLMEGKCGLNQVGQRYYLDFANAGTDDTPDGRRLFVPLESLDPHYSIDLACKITVTTRITLSATVQNLLNAKWEEAAGTLMPQRFATIKVTTAF